MGRIRFDPVRAMGLATAILAVLSMVAFLPLGPDYTTPAYRYPQLLVLIAVYSTIWCAAFWYMTAHGPRMGRVVSLLVILLGAVLGGWLTSLPSFATILWFIVFMGTLMGPTAAAVLCTMKLGHNS